MEDIGSPEVVSQMSMKEYRRHHAKEKKKFHAQLRSALASGNLECTIVDVVTPPPAIDMENIRGTDKSIASQIETFYAHDAIYTGTGKYLDPAMAYPPSMLDRYGKDLSYNAQGIYYRDFFSPKFVTSSREVWTPSFHAIDWDAPSEKPRRRRARVLVERNERNESWNKSEYVWEADAWSIVFNEMRDDLSLEINKHEYNRKMGKTDPVRCTLTGETTVIKRIPDATFGLATFSDRDSELPEWTYELHQDRLQKLLLHRKCGLLSDPKWGSTDLVFPFAVYEAKGWSGDYREARRQACLAAATYLDLLDDLVRTPEPVGSLKPYQTLKSHCYQVFALTSFGAHWHILVGYRRPREAQEHAGTEGMSEMVYIFQKVWSGRVIDERTAWELISLIEQIHLWAATDFRTFILDNLRPWHSFCEQNYFFDWHSVYDVDDARKTRRDCEEDKDILLPTWVGNLDDASRRKVQVQAKESLREAIKIHHSRKGKQRYEEGSRRLRFAFDKKSPVAYEECHGCLDEYPSVEIALEHLRDLHSYSERALAQTRYTTATTTQWKYLWKEDDNTTDALTPICTPGPSNHVPKIKRMKSKSIEEVKFIIVSTLEQTDLGGPWISDNNRIFKSAPGLSTQGPSGKPERSPWRSFIEAYEAKNPNHKERKWLEEIPGRPNVKRVIGTEDEVVFNDDGSTTYKFGARPKRRKTAR